MWPCCHGLYPLIISVIMQNRIMYTSVWIILQCRSLGTTFPLINFAWILCDKFISWPSYIGNIKIMKTSFIFIWDQSTITNFWVFFFLFFDFVEHLNLCCTYTHEIQTNQYKKNNHASTVLWFYCIMDVSLSILMRDNVFSSGYMHQL